MQSWLAIALAAAAIAVGEPEAGTPSASLTAPPSAEPVCVDPSATVHGPPAAELFDPYRPSAGQATWCERYDANGRSIRHGPYTDRYPGGALRSRAYFASDVLEGAVEIRHESGGVWVEARYANGLLEGPYVMYRPSGRVWLQAFYVAGVLDGPHRRHHPDGTLAAETHYRNGVEHGASRAFWPSGALRRERTVVDGVWDGPSATWFETGRVESEGSWAPCAPEAVAASCLSTGAARHGRWHTWHASGHRASRGQYRYGEKVGTWVYWDESGEPERVDAHGTDEHVRSIRATKRRPAPASVSSAPRGAARSATAQRRDTPPRRR